MSTAAVFGASWVELQIHGCLIISDCGLGGTPSLAFVSTDSEPGIQKAMMFSIDMLLASFTFRFLFDPFTNDIKSGFPSFISSSFVAHLQLVWDSFSVFCCSNEIKCSFFVLCLPIFISLTPHSFFKVGTVSDDNSRHPSSMTLVCSFYFCLLSLSFVFFCFFTLSLLQHRHTLSTLHHTHTNV